MGQIDDLPSIIFEPLIGAYEEPVTVAPKGCDINNCLAPHYMDGLCKYHHDFAWYKDGMPTLTFGRRGRREGNGHGIGIRILS